MGVGTRISQQDNEGSQMPMSNDSIGGQTNFNPAQQSTADWTGQNAWYNPGYQGGGGGGGNQGNDFLGSVFGQANAPPDVYFGGGPNGAAGATQYYQQQGRMAGTANAPTIGSQGTDAFNQQMGAAGAGAQNAAAQGSLAQASQNTAGNFLFNAAAGNGPSAAQNQLQAGTDAAIQANMAMANSARGQAGLANAQKNALVQNGLQTQQAANQSAQLRAQEMQAAQSQYANFANQMQNQYAQQQLGFQGLGMQGAQGLQGNALAQAQLRMQQNQLNQTGQLAYEQLGFNSQAEALQAAMANQQQAYGLNESNARNASSGIGGILAAAGGAMMFSDERVKKDVRDGGPSIDDALSQMRPHSFQYANAHFGSPGEHQGVMAQELLGSHAGSKMVVRDPETKALAVKIPEAASFLLGAVSRLNERLEHLEGGGKRIGESKLEEPHGGKSAWTLREEPNFIAARNDRTGEVEKLATEPLSPKDAEQVKAPHGAGPFSKHGDMGLMGGGGDSTPKPQGMPLNPTSPQMMNANGIGGNMMQMQMGAPQQQPQDLGQPQNIGQGILSAENTYKGALDMAAKNGDYMAGGI